MNDNNKNQDSDLEKAPGTSSNIQQRKFIQKERFFMLDGFSPLYPSIAWSKQEVYAIPRSIECVCSCLGLSKSQRNKLEQKPYHTGQMVNIVVNTDEKDRAVKKVSECAVEGPRIGVAPGRLLKTFCVLSNESPMRCYAYFLGLTEVSPEVPKVVGVVPNFVYEGLFQSVVTANMERARVLDIQVQFKLMQLLNIVGSKEKKQSYEFESNAPWIKGIPSELRPTTMTPNPTEVPRIPEQSANLKSVHLWHFEGGRLVRMKFPKTCVKVSPGVFSKAKTDTGKPVRLPPIADGQFLLGNMVYYQTEECYIVDSYELPEHDPDEGEEKGKYRLKTKAVLLENGECHTEYLVAVMESVYRELYNCEELGFALIADPNRLLRNLSRPLHQKGYPVWIRLEREHNRLAQFSITALHEQSYSKEELQPYFQMVFPEIVGRGFLVDPKSGTVYAPTHPQTRIRLTVPDRMRYRVGEYFHFVAAYYEEKELYLVCNLHKALDECAETRPMQLFTNADGLILFKHTLLCHIREWEDGHETTCGLGPVGDPRRLVLAHARRKFHAANMLAIQQREKDPSNEDNVPFPKMEDFYAKKLEVYLKWNRKWAVGENTQLIVHSVEGEGLEPLSPDAFLPSAEQLAEWWVRNGGKGSAETDESDDQEEHVWSILYDILHSEGVHDALEPEMMEELVKVVQANKPSTMP